MSKKDSPMQKYQGGGKTYEEPKIQTPSSKKEYKAIDSQSRRVSRFRIIDKNLDSYGCAYSHLIDWVYSPDHTLTLTTSSRIFILSGKELGKIEELLLEEKIKALHIFNPEHHKQGEIKKTYIDSLEVVNPSKMDA